MQLSDTDIVQPDIIAVAGSNDRTTVDARVVGPPDLVVEILSPSTRRVDRGAKRALYEIFRVREYWIIASCMASWMRWPLPVRMRWT